MKFSNYLIDMLPAVVRNYSFPICYADSGAAAASFGSSAAATNNNNSTTSQRRIVPTILGQSPNTGIQNNSATRLAAAYRKARQLPPINQMLPEEFEGDSLSNYIANFCRWAANTPVPHRFNEDLGAPDANRCLSADTKIQYIGKHLKDLRLNIVPKHPDFEGLKNVDRDHPSWWTDLRTRFEEEAGRFKAKNPGDEVFGHPDVIPLYRDLRHRRGGNDVDWEDDPRVMVDVRMVMLSLVKKKSKHDSNIEFANWIYDVFDGCGRTGEVKFQYYNDWRFDYLLQVVDAPWQETKVLDCYSRACLPDDDWLFDFYVMKGAFYMCESGLFRTEEQKKKGVEHVVYPSLHSISDNSVAKKISNILSKEVGKKLGEDWEDLERITSRGLRSGSISQLSMYPGISIFEATALTGHSVGNLKSYLDQRNIVKALPAANALHQNKSLYVEPVLPTLESINAGPGGANEEAFKRLVQHMFTVSIKDFQPGHKHYIILVTCALSLIRHYQDIISECGVSNFITSQLFTAAKNAKITDGESLYNPYSNSTAAVIERWSSLMKEDISRRQKVKDAEALKSDHTNSVLVGLLTSIAGDVKDQKDQSAVLVRDLATAKSSQAQLIEQLEANKASITSLEAENAFLKQQLQAEKDKYRALSRFVKDSTLKSPDKTTSSEPLLPPLLQKRRLDYSVEEVSKDVEMLGSASEETAVSNSRGTSSAPAETPQAIEIMPQPQEIMPQPQAVNVNPPSSSSVAHHDITVRADSNLTESSAHMFASLELNQDNEPAGDRGKRFLSLLLELANMDLVKPGTKLQGIEIPRSLLIANPTHLTYCLEVVDFTCDPRDVEIVATYRKNDASAEKLQAMQAGVRIEDTVYEKLFEFERRTAADARQTLGRTIGGLSKRIKKYKNEIKDATKDTRDISRIPLIEVAELQSLIANNNGNEPAAESQVQEGGGVPSQPVPAAAAGSEGVSSVARVPRGRSSAGGQRSIMSYAAPVLRSEEGQDDEDGEGNVVGL